MRLCGGLQRQNGPAWVGCVLNQQMNSADMVENGLGSTPTWRVPGPGPTYRYLLSLSTNRFRSPSMPAVFYCFKPPPSQHACCAIVQGEVSKDFIQKIVFLSLVSSLEIRLAKYCNMQATIYCFRENLLDPKDRIDPIVSYIPKCSGSVAQIQTSRYKVAAIYCFIHSQMWMGQIETIYCLQIRKSQGSSPKDSFSRLAPSLQIRLVEYCKLQSLVLEKIRQRSYPKDSLSPSASSLEILLTPIFTDLNARIILQDIIAAVGRQAR